MDVGNEEIDLRKKNLLSWQNILNSRQITADIKEKLANQREVLHGWISCIYLSLSNEWKPCHWAINSQPRNIRMTLEKYFQFQKLRVEAKSSIVNLRFISQFSLKLSIQFWKYLHSMVLGSVGRRYCITNSELEFLAKIFLVRLPQCL